MSRTVKVKNIPTWLENRYKRMWAHYIETPEGCFYIVEGVRVPALDFENQYPVKLVSTRNQFGKPLDGRSNFY